MSKWNDARVKRYIKLYGDPREMRGSQSQLCADASALVEGDIVDFGCGLGHLIPYVKGNYVGLDSSPDMLHGLKGFFPDATVHEVDVTKIEGLDLPCDYAVSNSLFIHLARDEMIETLKNMWGMAKKGIAFSMETKGDTEHIRKDGIRIRNQSPDAVVDTVKEALRLDEIDEIDISWGHQCSQYTMAFVITPSKDSPLEYVSRGMNARTTLFKVNKP